MQTKILRQRTYRYRFHVDHHVNWLIVEGDWRQLHDDVTYTIHELSHLITNYYKLKEDIETTLCYRYITNIGEERKRTH
jgi:hypothetical protein